MPQLLLPEEKLRLNKLPKLHVVILSYLPRYYNLKKERCTYLLLMLGKLPLRQLAERLTF